MDLLIKQGPVATRPLEERPCGPAHGKDPARRSGRVPGQVQNGVEPRQPANGRDNDALQIVHSHTMRIVFQGIGDGFRLWPATERLPDPLGDAFIPVSRFDIQMRAAPRP